MTKPDFFTRFECTPPPQTLYTSHSMNFTALYRNFRLLRLEPREEALDSFCEIVLRRD